MDPFFDLMVLIQRYNTIFTTNFVIKLHLKMFDINNSKIYKKKVIHYSSHTEMKPCA